MLLFLMRGKFELPEGPPPRAVPVIALREDARALLVAAMVLCAWCVLRLLSARGQGFDVDIALAVLALGLGIWAALHGARSLLAATR